MKVALIGSVSSSFHALDALIRGGVEVTGVLGVDESRAGRIGDYRSLRELARAANLPFQSFVKVREPAVRRFLETHQPDLLWVIGLSQLVPDDVISIARVAGVGFHPTMLPRGRGRAPVAWTIILGERAAVSLFCLTDEPDAGDIIIQREVPVLPDDYSEDLIARTNEALFDAILELAPVIEAGSLPRAPQDHAKATYYGKRTPADGVIHWHQPTDRIHRLVRAAGRPYPGAFTFSERRKLTVWRAEPSGVDEVGTEASTHEPGTIIDVDPRRGVLVRTLDGGLWLTETAGAAGEELKPGSRLSTRA